MVLSLCVGWRKSIKPFGADAFPMIASWKSEDGL